MMTVRRFNSLLLLALLTVSGSSSMKVVGRVGEDVTVPCMYDAKNDGVSPACWGRGPVPNWGCCNQILATDGRSVVETTRVSSRYQLLGRLEDGDFSLTILNITEEDAAWYGCRMMIYGPFARPNHNIYLAVEKSQVTATQSVPASSDSNGPEIPETHRAASEETTRD